MSDVMGAVRLWADMVKFSHSIFALPFAAIAMFLAGSNIEGRGYPTLMQIILIVVCMVAARSAAMTFNRIVDAEIDARNPRTANRPLPAKKLGRPAAYTMFVLSVLTFGMGCTGFYLLDGNTWPTLLSGPVLLYLCLYSYAKRFTKYSHFILGSGIAFAPVAAWIAIHPASLGWEAVLLMISVTCWIGGFDIIYACLDIEFDKQEGLHSLPAKIGAGPALWIARLCHAIAVAAWIGLGMLADLGWAYAIGVVIAGSLLVIENALVQPGDYRRVNLAFFTLNGVISVLLAGLTITDIFV